MRVCLDECVDRRLAAHIPDHEVATVAGMNWRGLSNGALLTNVAAEFEVFITTDRNLAFQQNLVEVDVAVIVLRAKSNRLDDLLPLVPRLLHLIESAPKRQATTCA